MPHPALHASALLEGVVQRLDEWLDTLRPRVGARMAP
jgi:hypothetical protein